MTSVTMKSELSQPTTESNSHSTSLAPPPRIPLARQWPASSIWPCALARAPPEE
jgi:hypothetical protein